MHDFDSISGFVVRYVSILFGIFVSFLVPWALVVAFGQVGTAQARGSSAKPTFTERIFAKMKIALFLCGPPAGAGAVIALVLVFIIYAAGYLGIKVEKLGNVDMKEWPIPVWVTLGIFWDILWFKIIRSIREIPQG